MKVQFEFTTADMAEVASRNLQGSPLVRRWRIRSAVVGAALMGMFAFALTPGDLLIRIVVAGVFAVIVGGAAGYAASRPGASTRTEALYREKLGGQGPFSCEVELTTEGVVSRQLGQELFHPWSSVASLSEIPGAIEFVFTPIASLLVRDRAFREPQARADFLVAAREQLPQIVAAQASSKRVPESPPIAAATEKRTVIQSLSEREYLVAWLLFFVCVSVSNAVVSAAIGAATGAMARTRGAELPVTVPILGGLIFIVSACLSYFFFRLFTRRLLARMQWRLAVIARGPAS